MWHRASALRPPAPSSCSWSRHSACCRYARRRRRGAGPSTRCIFATSARRRPADGSTTSQIDPANPAVLYVAAATGGIWKSTNNGVTWKDVFVQQPDSTFGALAIFERDPKIVWAGIGRTEQPPELVVGRRRLSLDRRGRDVDATSVSTTRARSDASCSIPRTPTSRYIAAAGNLWTGNAERGVFKTTRRRTHVDQGALRRYVHRRDRPRDGSARLEACSTPRPISACARHSASTAADPAARSTRRPMPARRGRSSRTAFHLATRGRIGLAIARVEAGRARRDHRARRRPAAPTAPRTRARRGSA